MLLDEDNEKQGNEEDEDGETDDEYVDEEETNDDEGEKQMRNILMKTKRENTKKKIDMMNIIVTMHKKQISLIHRMINGWL